MEHNDMNKTIAIFALAAAVTSTVITASASTFTIEGSDNSFAIKSSGVTVGVTVDGTDVGLLSGPGWTYDADAKQLTISADCTLSGRGQYPARRPTPRGYQRPARHLPDRHR